MLVASAWWVDAGSAVGTGVVAALVWTLLAAAYRRRRLRRALDAFVGSYAIHRKLLGDEVGGEVRICRAGDQLEIDWPDNPRGPARGTVVLSEHFLRSARGVYEHRLNDGRLAWGSWEMDLGAAGDSILVTTRYVSHEDPVEIVQAYEWRRVESEKSS